MLLSANPGRRIAVYSCFVVSMANAAPPINSAHVGVWNPKAAAAYLDRRIDWWTTWPGATRDHGTFCISCHTAVAYSLARPALNSAIGEAAPSPGERRCLDNVTKRVQLWREVAPFYGGSQAEPSRGTEAVLNALILASRDARSGVLSSDSRTALANMWGLQVTSGTAKGSWQWIQFNNEPWEAHDSQYYGAALAAIAVGSAPGSYRSAPESQARIEWLREYLNRELTKQSPINQAVVLWASARWPGLLAKEQRSALISNFFKKQQADGGWCLASLMWTWRDWSFTSLAKLYAHSEATPLYPKSDGYATGLITFAKRNT
jgi:hypothetical protein